jgi:hypothetical protein
MTAEGGRPYCAAGGNACDSFQIGLRERPCPEGECGVRPLDWEPFRDSAGRAAQPSESEREGAQMEHNACDRCARDLGDKAYCRQCAGPPPSPPSTGQSREPDTQLVAAWADAADERDAKQERVQELEAALRDCIEALEHADQHFQEIRMDWSDPREEIRAGRAWIEPALAAARRALESKP